METSAATVSTTQWAAVMTCLTCRWGTHGGQQASFTILCMRSQPITIQLGGVVYLLPRQGLCTGRASTSLSDYRSPEPAQPYSLQCHPAAKQAGQGMRGHGGGAGRAVAGNLLVSTRDASHSTPTPATARRTLPWGYQAPTAVREARRVLDGDHEGVLARGRHLPAPYNARGEGLASRCSVLKDSGLQRPDKLRQLLRQVVNIGQRGYLTIATFHVLASISIVLGCI